jgi:hypothetical protein
VANAEDAFEAAAELLPGTSEADVRDRINKMITSAGITGDLPMCGEVVMADGISPATTIPDPVTLHRSIARVDVENALPSTEFLLKEVYVFRPRDMVSVIPNTTLPSVNEDSEFLSTPISKSVTAGAEAITQLYIPESTMVEDESDKVSGTTVVVVGGNYHGSSDVSYYRIDFDSNTERFGEVIRNHRYIFRITGVMAPGFAEAEDAADSYGTELQVEVEDWHDFSSEMYFGQHHLTLSDRILEMPFFRYSTTTIDIDSTLPYTVQWLDGNGDPTGNIASAPNDMISSGRFEATIIKKPTDSYNVSHIEFRTLQDNNLETVPDTLKLMTSRWNIKILVNQENTMAYATKTVNIMSTDGYGSLGNMNDAGTVNSSAGMRAIIDANFAPGSRFNIAGINYTEVPLGDVSVADSLATNYKNTRRMLRQQDVVFLTYDATPSANMCKHILEWLNEDSRRVLIVATDDVINYNKNMVALLTDDCTWNTGGSNDQQSNDGAGAYNRAPDAVGTQPFFYGPFGDVGPMSGHRADDIAGYSLNYATAGVVVPLIVGNKNPLAMYFGVNFSRRIVYMGDMSMFTTALSGTDGVIRTDTDRMLANMWAWIAAHVIYGDDYRVDF